MLQAEKERVYIEFCVNCNSHQYCTKHDESKYKSYYDACFSKIMLTCPEVQVVPNQIPVAFRKNFTTSEGKPKPWAGKMTFPRMGAFEVFYKDKLIFSKLESGKWPQAAKVAERIREILDQPKQEPPKSVTSQSKPRRKKLRKRKLRKTNRSTKPNSKRRAKKTASDQEDIVVTSNPKFQVFNRQPEEKSSELESPAFPESFKEETYSPQYLENQKPNKGQFVFDKTSSESSGEETDPKEGTAKSQESGQLNHSNFDLSLGNQEFNSDKVQKLIQDSLKPDESSGYSSYEEDFPEKNLEKVLDQQSSHSEPSDYENEFEESEKEEEPKDSQNSEELPKSLTPQEPQEPPEEKQSEESYKSEPFDAENESDYSSSEESAEEKPKREVTKSYDLTLPVNQVSNKKITYQNKTSETSEFFLWSSEPQKMGLKDNIVVIQPEQKGKFQLRFNEVDFPHDQTYYLYVDRNGEPWECIQLNITYQ